ncbi:hypothetical protein BAUCODRAFT_148152 [Baudoinia panamericana UAMH 10762]|uniref:Alpha/beta hydrolase fold-3 domain-containing protein n=1 Tax=Baudoinia panamericana (strain UAMH 10762) TaxID=717646 RepID=M2MYB8_BAUPA|nr:uncharacterized protein BAUCODRAFT_148152 [Baudoinia panamericana UAMH 10762]EMC96563.1 hypothetical protein BAUCODRAFT_148152 [Baudoinia panamericana UAMH 10762]
MLLKVVDPGTSLSSTSLLTTIKIPRRRCEPTAPQGGGTGPELINALGGKLPFLPQDPAARRDAFNHMLAENGRKLPVTVSEISTKDVQVDDNVSVRIYQPSTAKQGGKLPLLVFYHGGGWIAGNLDIEDHMCRTVCGEAECIVVSVDYRLTPEVDFATMLNDCFAAAEWAHSKAAELNADPQRYGYWGGSAGGALALAAAYRLISSGKRDHISAIILMSPMCLHPDATPEKYRHLHRSTVENSGLVPIVTWDDCVASYRANDVLPPYGDRKAAWFPTSLGSEALKDMPPTYIYNTDLECMRDDGTVLEAELRDAGVSTKRDVMPGLPHYFWVLP